GRLRGVLPQFLDIPGPARTLSGRPVHAARIPRARDRPGAFAPPGADRPGARLRPFRMGRPRLEHTGHRILHVAGRRAHERLDRLSGHGTSPGETGAAAVSFIIVDRYVIERSCNALIAAVR